MISDKALRIFADASDTTVSQAIGTTAAVTTYSNYNIDLVGNVPTSGNNPNSNGLQYRDIGEGDDLYLAITVATTFVGGTSVQFVVQAGTDKAQPPAGVIDLGTSNAVLTADLAAGYQVFVRINPLWAKNGLRYLSAKMVGVGTFSAGAVFGDIVTDISDSKKFYASGFSVV
jgi:hypothetical protein